MRCLSAGEAYGWSKSALRLSDIWSIRLQPSEGARDLALFNWRLIRSCAAATSSAVPPQTAT